ncbi:MAG: ABC transporter ATP-binding protein, partial [Myxococcales bacterium]|nr:ABC transporter ATP-binding protein [Myxococcales bacterium]
KAEAGRIRFNGQTVEPGARSLRAELGVVFQKPSLDPNLTCLENLRMACRLNGVRGKTAEERVTSLLAFADLADRAGDVVKTLSGGMKRRLELARGLVHQPRLLIMDEPTTGLDEASFHRTWQRLQALRAEAGLSILLSTHRPEEAARCDRLALIADGRVVACDTPAALQAAVSGDVITVFGDDPDGLVEALHSRFAVEPRRVDGGVRFRCDAGHTLIPRVVEAFPAGRLRAIHLKQPSLADVFLKLTGQTLEDEDAA